MPTELSITFSVENRVRLVVLVKDRNAPLKNLWLGQIVLLAGHCVGTNEIVRRTGKSKTCVRRWQRGFASEGVDGLACDRAQLSPVKPLAADIVARVAALRLEAPTGETTHWTGAPMEKVSGVSVGSLQRVWRQHGRQPHRTQQLNLSKDPRVEG